MDWTEGTREPIGLPHASGSLGLFYEQGSAQTVPTRTTTTKGLQGLPRSGEVGQLGQADEGGGQQKACNE